MSLRSGSRAVRGPLRRNGPGEMLVQVVCYVFLALFCLSILYPFWVTIVLSFTPVEQIRTLGLRIWLDDWSLTSYRFAFSTYGNVFVAYRNTILRTVLGSALTVVVTLFGAYPLSKRDLPGRSFMTIVILIPLFFSGGFIPLYLIVRNLGLIDTFPVLILLLLAVPYYIIIMRNFFMTVDPAFEEAAFMDGAGYLQILFRIIAPLSKPVLATVALWAAVAYWNEWFHAMVFTTGKENLVLQLLLRRMIEHASDIEIAIQNGEMFFGEQIRLEGVKAAVTLVTIGPIVLAYPFFQRFFVRGILVGALKG